MRLLYETGEMKGFDDLGILENSEFPRQMEDEGPISINNWVESPHFRRNYYLLSHSLTHSLVYSFSCSLTYQSLVYTEISFIQSHHSHLSISTSLFSSTEKPIYQKEQ